MGFFSEEFLSWLDQHANEMINSLVRLGSN